MGLELALAEADPAELGGDRLREPRRGFASRRPKLAVQPLGLGLCRLEGLGRRSHGIVAVGDRVELGAGGGGAGEQLPVVEAR